MELYIWQNEKQTNNKEKGKESGKTVLCSYLAQSMFLVFLIRVKRMLRALNSECLGSRKRTNCIPENTIPGLAHN